MSKPTYSRATRPAGRSRRPWSARRGAASRPTCWWTASAPRISTARLVVGDAARRRAFPRLPPERLAVDVSALAAAAAASQARGDRRAHGVRRRHQHHGRRGPGARHAAALRLRGAGRGTAPGGHLPRGEAAVAAGRGDAVSLAPGRSAGPRSGRGAARQPARGVPAARQRAASPGDRGCLSRRHRRLPHGNPDRQRVFLSRRAASGAR